MLQFFFNTDYLNLILSKPRSKENYLQAHKQMNEMRMLYYGSRVPVQNVTVMIPALESRSQYHTILADELTRQGLRFEFDYTEGISRGET